MNRFHAIVVSIVSAACVVIHAQAGLAGKWRGATASGRPVVLDVKVNAKQLTGTFTLNQQSATITEGKVEDKTFSFKATVEGRTLTFNGRLLGDEIELIVEDVPDPLTLKRVKERVSALSFNAARVRPAPRSTRA
jgi:hypothetical protein